LDFHRDSNIDGIRPVHSNLGRHLIRLRNRDLLRNWYWHLHRDLHLDVVRYWNRDLNRVRDRDRNLLRNLDWVRTRYRGRNRDRDANRVSDGKLEGDCNWERLNNALVER
jgi:hypothetical protein